MNTVLIVILVPAALTLPALALDWWDRRRAAKAQARRLHPSNCSDDTEAAIEQAVGIVDDGAALVAEAEAFLKNGGRP